MLDSRHVCEGEARPRPRCGGGPPALLL